MINNYFKKDNLFTKDLSKISKLELKNILENDFVSVEKKNIENIKKLTLNNNAPINFNVNPIKIPVQEKVIQIEDNKIIFNGFNETDYELLDLVDLNEKYAVFEKPNEKILNDVEWAIDKLTLEDLISTDTDNCIS